MMLVRISNAKQSEQFECTGVLDFGRSPRGRHRRFRLDDVHVSRSHLRIEELPDGQVRLENLSTHVPVFLAGGPAIAAGAEQTLFLPVQITVGHTQIELRRLPAPEASGVPTAGVEESHPSSTNESFQTLAGAPASRLVKGERSPPAAPTGGGGSLPDTLTQWLETLIVLQHAAAGSADFYQQTAEALVRLIGLDLGLVLLRRQDHWTVAAAHAAGGATPVRYSRTVVDHVAASGATVYQDIFAAAPPTNSMINVEAFVASPIFGVQEDVVGVLYGLRVKQVLLRGGVRPMEAQLVQLLAAAVGAHLARSAAVRTRVQFEQFFSPELVRELERNPDLLEGRSQDVTVLFSDLRGFTAMSQRLGAANACRLLRAVMERLSERIFEHGGVIVDYAGDGILAMWNAPTEQPDHATRACRAALAMLGELPRLNEQWYELTSGTLALGVGVNTGPAQVGNTGSSRKFKYGPHGHTVNLAHRVQNATKQLGTPLLITAATHDLLVPMATRRIGRARLPDVEKPVALYELHGEAALPEWESRRDAYEQALAEYEAGQWDQACQTLLPLSPQAADPPDGPALKLLRRAQECLRSRPDPFDPTIT